VNLEVSSCLDREGDPLKAATVSPAAGLAADEKLASAALAAEPAAPEDVSPTEMGLSTATAKTTAPMPASTLRTQCARLHGRLPGSCGP
jgi:hypothetical protein